MCVSDPRIKALGGFERVNVRQGYAACAVCVLDSNTIITADQGILKAARDRGIVCHEIRPGGFLLDGFKEGFVGGSMFRCGDTVYCTGTLAQHPDKERITDILRSKSLELCPLTPEPAFDIGGIVMLSGHA